MSDSRFQTYREFWPFYVGEHANPRNRRLHFIGTSLVIICLSIGIFFEPWFLAAAPFAGYGFAWVGHFLVEHNRPATFKYPLWSLRGDFHMFGLMLIGKMNDEITRTQTNR